MDFIKAILPWIGTALGGPLGGMALSFVGDKLGVKADTIKDLENTLKGMTPEQLVAAKTADQEFQLRMQELGFKNEYDLEVLATKDRDSARNREIQTGDYTTRIIASAFTVGYFTTLGICFFYKMPDSNEQLVTALLTIMSTAMIAIINYYFGSSKGSTDKSNQLADIAAKK